MIYEYYLHFEYNVPRNLDPFLDSHFDSWHQVLNTSFALQSEKPLASVYTLLRDRCLSNSFCLIQSKGYRPFESYDHVPLPSEQDE